MPKSEDGTMSTGQRFRFDEGNFKAMVEHVFLPRKLSPSFNPLKVVDHESSMLALLSDVVNHLASILPKEARQLINMMAELQLDSELNIENVSQAIKALQPGNMLGLYIRQQNCGWLLYSPPEAASKQVVVSTFPASLPNEVICDSPNDVQVSHLFRRLRVGLELIP